MLLREVEYARPATVDEAVATLAAHDGARALAGGQTLINVMKQRAAAPEVLVDLADLDELRTIGFSSDGMLEIGAMVTCAQLIGSSEVDVARPIIAEVAATIADVQVRNRGTIGGNVCVSDPTNHFPVLLVALDATFTILGAGGERRVLRVVDDRQPQRARVGQRVAQERGRPDRSAVVGEAHDPGIRKLAERRAGDRDEASDVLLPVIHGCFGCHRKAEPGESAEASPLGRTICIACHTYHPEPEETAARGGGENVAP